MTLRWTEAELRAWQREKEKKRKLREAAEQPAKSAGDRGFAGDPAVAGRTDEISRPVPRGYASGPSPSCCQPARPSGVSLAGDPAKRSKYGNQRTEVDGILFDSKHEAQVYEELMLRVRSGELKAVCRQVRFDLGGGPWADRDSRYRYVADFVTIDPDNRIEVLDAKSEATRKNRTYINKKKQMLAEWGLDIREV